MANFFNLRCPHCRRDDAIDIQALVWIRIGEDGTDADESHSGDHEYTDESLARCDACAHEGPVTEFEQEDSEATSAEPEGEPVP